jgi:hypothetical protein
MRSIRFGILTALLVFPAALNAQVVRVSPFLGTDLETWDNSNSGSDLPLAFNGLASFGGAGVSVYRTASSFYEPGLGLGEYMAKTQSGLFGLAKASESSTPVIITFARPIDAFGGYWAALSGFSLNESHAIGFRFLDASAQLVGSDVFVYSEPNHDGTLEWAGWSFARPVSQIEYSAWYVANDSLTVIAIPEPNTASVCMTAFAACWLVWLSKRPNWRAA